MQLHEFAKIVMAMAERHPDDEVVIETQNGGVPRHWLAPVKSISVGFDWARGFVIIWPENPLCRVKLLNRKISEVAREQLDRLKQQHETIFHQPYLPKAREAEWIDGFVHGVKAMVTSAEDSDGNQKSTNP